MKFEKIDLSKYSRIDAQFNVNSEDSILIAKFSGDYRSGIDGNMDGLFMLSKLAQYYFYIDPIILIVDLQELNYTWGNTLLNVINFSGSIEVDSENLLKSNIVITSTANHSAILKLSTFLEDCKIEFCETYPNAIQIATKLLDKKLEP